MIRYRGGRSNPHTLYEQLGPEPKKGDRAVGAVFLPSETGRVVALLNVGAAREAAVNGEIPYADVPLVAITPEDARYLVECAEEAFNAAPAGHPDVLRFEAIKGRLGL